MQTKHLLTMSLLMPLMAVSATAQAGSTISDRSYWPSEARQSTSPRADQQRGVNSAFAYDRTPSTLQPAITSSEGWSRPYQGGPKGR
ncbi:hypothetical protein QA641_31750 [Bradyrhizobium sp. CB1650]|uniref:hypothetical protein n=1 Tax=Bradyrhizobium sp. CB1650 TaxID=3039153 RepID=UPI00243614A2|nr:hypothetical protein [Bradyrhizobium sp. CB1650]WGD50162.1 hypothetical protein QA641_31750 [Bradyrhizobium sp. CB1650]